MAFLSLVGAKAVSVPNHKLWIILAKKVESSPFVPKGLVLFISLTYFYLMKYSTIYAMCEMHCSPEFMKQVFPRFLNPTFPNLDSLVYLKGCYYSSDSASFGQRPLWVNLSLVLQLLEQYAAYLHEQITFSLEVTLQDVQGASIGFLELKNIQFLSYLSSNTNWVMILRSYSFKVLSP